MRGITQLTTGKWQARRYEHGKTISCGVHATEDEAIAALRSHAVSCDEPHAVVSHDPDAHATHAKDAIHLSASGSCSTTPAPETTSSPAAVTTERQPGSLADYLAPASIALLDEVMAVVPTIPSMDRANDRALAIFKKYMWEQQTNPDWAAYKKSLKQG